MSLEESAPAKASTPTGVKCGVCVPTAVHSGFDPAVFCLLVSSVSRVCSLSSSLMTTDAVPNFLHSLLEGDMGHGLDVLHERLSGTCVQLVKRCVPAKCRCSTCVALCSYESVLGGVAGSEPCTITYYILKKN